MDDKAKKLEELKPKNDENYATIDVDNKSNEDELEAKTLDNLPEHQKKKMLKKFGIKMPNNNPKHTKKYYKRPTGNRKKMIKRSKKMNQGK